MLAQTTCCHTTCHIGINLCYLYYEAIKFFSKLHGHSMMAYKGIDNYGGNVEHLIHDLLIMISGYIYVIHLHIYSKHIVQQ